MVEQSFVDSQSGHWQALDQFPGTHIIPLAEPVPDGSIHRLRMEAGSVIPIHSHPCSEYVYVVSGVLETGGRNCEQGTFWTTPANEQQGPHKALTDVEIITIRLGPMGTFEN